MQLTYGDYELAVRVEPIEPEENVPATKVKFVILPPFYLSSQAINFYIFCVLFVISTTLIVFYLYVEQRSLERNETIVRTKLTALKDNNDSMRRIMEHKQKMMADISHEIRTPLTLVTQPIKEIIEHIHDPELEEKVESITRNADRVTYLVEQLLEVERLNYIYDVPTQEYDIHETATFVVDSLKPLTEQKSQVLVFRSLAKGKIRLYQDTLQQIFYNLVSNAVKYSPEKSEILVKTLQSYGELIITVKDQGPGLSEDEAKMIFSRFNRLGGTGNEKGIGIGLSLVRQLVKANSGIIDVTSKPGEGAEFRVVLPMAGQQIDESARESSISVNRLAPLIEENETQPVIDDPSQPMLLIADDSQEMREFLHTLFKEEFICYITKNGKEAYEAACQLHPELILTDFKMPIMSGVELAHKIRQNKLLTHTPIFMLTGMNDRASIQSGYDALVDEYILKPFDKAILLKKVKNRLALNTKMRESVTIKAKEQEGEDFFSEIPKLEKERDQQFYVQLRKCFDLHGLDPDFNREQCAKLLNVSERQLNRKLEIVTNKSFTDTLKTFRLFRAKQMLQEGRSVTDTAFECGFNNPSYFSTLFKGYTDLTPTEYALQYQKVTTDTV